MNLPLFKAMPILRLRSGQALRRQDRLISKPMTTKLATLTEQTSLPAGWRWARLGDVCVPTETRDPRREPEQIFKYVDITSVDNLEKRVVFAREILGKDAPSRARQVIRAGDVIVSTTRPNLNAANQLDAQFLFAFVQAEKFITELSEQVKGALYPVVTDAQVRAVEIPLPPLPEQRRIAARLNEIMAEIARARAAAQSQLDAINALPAAYLRKAFRGEL